MVNLKYLVLLICSAQILYCSAIGIPIGIAGAIVDKVIPDCFFGVQTISFILYTRDIPDGIVLTAENITSTDAFEKHVASRSVVFIAHGFISYANTTQFNDLSKALLEKENVLVIAIDWRQGACSDGLSLTELTGYYKAANNTRAVGQYIAHLTKLLIDKYGAKLDKMLVIGHSLGAQVVGFAGKEVQNLKLGKYPQIIGLDPARPYFAEKDCSGRLCKEDADYVQIIHTTRSFGISKPIGHIDFYMNKGYLQPGCFTNPLCSHSRSIVYLTESIKHECCFIGTRWTSVFGPEPISKCTRDTCACVGINARNYPAKGKFYAKVDIHSPYCSNNGMVL